MRPYTGRLNKVTELRFMLKLFKAMCGEIGFMQAVRLFRDFISEKVKIAHMRFRCMVGRDVQANREILHLVSLQAAFYLTLKKYLPDEKAKKYYEEAVGAAGAASLRRYMPARLDSYEPFQHLKDALPKIFEENKKSQLHNYEIVKSDNESFQLNVTMCILHEMLKELGIPESCIAGCQSDHIFFAEYLKDTDIQFSRKGTLAKGDKVCDFCFHRPR